MKIKDIISCIETTAPLANQEEWDNSGLQVCPFDEGTDAEVTGVMVCLDITENAIVEAADVGCNMLISHHPLIFRPLKSVGVENAVQRCVLTAVKKGVCIYSAHTSLDNARGGVNYKIADMLGLERICFLEPLSAGQTGSGVFAHLPKPMAAKDFLAKVKSVFGSEALSWAGPEEKIIHTVAICGGAGSFLIEKAKMARADFFLTGEISYHNFFDADDIVLASIGHFESEHFTVDLICDILGGWLRQKRLSNHENPQVADAVASLPVLKASSMRNPVKTLK